MICLDREVFYSFATGWSNRPEPAGISEKQRLPGSPMGAYAAKQAKKKQKKGGRSRL
jgi:hypothetical protein